jgi:hypothetical protein
MRSATKSPGAQDLAHGAAENKLSVLVTKVLKPHMLRTSFKTAVLAQETGIQERMVQDGRLVTTDPIIKMALGFKVPQEVLSAANTNEIPGMAQSAALIQTACNLRRKYLGVYPQLKDAKIVLEAWCLARRRNGAPQPTES